MVESFDGRMSEYSVIEIDRGYQHLAPADTKTQSIHPEGVRLPQTSMEGTPQNFVERFRPIRTPEMSAERRKWEWNMGENI